MHNTKPLQINASRLLQRLSDLAEVGTIAGGGVCRLALTDADKQGRDLVCQWMKDLGLEVSIDKIGNVVGIRAGTNNVPPVMTGSHIDTVATGGRFDGNLGVLAGLEVINTLNDAGITTEKPLAVGFFTNEEGARFAPDMMGSAVHQGALALNDALQTRAIDGPTVTDELNRIGYAGDIEVGHFRPDSFIELHIEQGPVLELEGIEIGAVTGVQGISWHEYDLFGTSNHAGTTPMHLRHDAAFVAAAIAVEARSLALEMGGTQVATVGVTELKPNLINVIPNHAHITVDLRNTDEALLQSAEARLWQFITTTAEEQGVTVKRKQLARFSPVVFDTEMVELVASFATTLGHSCKKMPSGAGHDAQMFAVNCPTAMIFVPSQGGLSHNVAEFTHPENIEAGANVLLRVLLDKAGQRSIH